MAEELGALTLLGESADWLKDAEGVSIRDYRMAAIEAYRASWDKPLKNDLHQILRAAMEQLIAALCYNHLYPDGIVFGEDNKGDNLHLPNQASLRKDFERIREFSVVNRFGIGEIHLLYVTLLLYRALHEDHSHPYDQMLEDSVGDVVHLRLPLYRADNLAPFSAELLGRYHAVRLLRSMRRLGLLDDEPVSHLSPQEQAEITALLADKLRLPASEYIKKPNRRAFAILDTATALEAYARAHAANRAPLDERTAEEIFVSLRHNIRRVVKNMEEGIPRRDRLCNLGMAAMIRAVPHVDPMLGRKIYSFLRSGNAVAIVRHGRMFKLLPNNPERLAFLNFLYTNGTQNPVYYIQKFEKYFQGDKLRFVRKEIGFQLQREEEAS